MKKLFLAIIVSIVPGLVLAQYSVNTRVVDRLETLEKQLCTCLKVDGRNFDVRYPGNFKLDIDIYAINEKDKKIREKEGCAAVLASMIDSWNLIIDDFLTENREHPVSVAMTINAIVNSDKAGLCEVKGDTDAFNSFVDTYPTMLEKKFKANYKGFVIYKERENALKTDFLEADDYPGKKISFTDMTLDPNIFELLKLNIKDDFLWPAIEAQGE